MQAEEEEKRKKKNKYRGVGRRENKRDRKMAVEVKTSIASMQAACTTECSLT